jgi:hypothetical protein
MSARKVSHFQRSSVRHVACPKCSHRFPLPEAKINPFSEESSEELRCIKCMQPIEGEPLSFGGGFACEPCVIAYYQPHGPEIAAREIRERRICAKHMLPQRGKV